jgi:hypothetical protein
VVDERGDVVSHQPEVDQPVDVGGTAVPLQVECDDLVALGQRGRCGCVALISVKERSTE